MIELARHIIHHCPELRLKGLMTIGSYGASASDDDNPDFTSLTQTRSTLIKVLAEMDGETAAVKEIMAEGLELSMGMSGDFADAIRQGSTNVRVGSSIFGARPPFKG